MNAKANARSDDDHEAAPRKREHAAALRTRGLAAALGGFDANVADTFTQMAAEAWSSRASP